MVQVVQEAQHHHQFRDYLDDLLLLDHQFVL